jgi:hypothetical protein
MAWVPVGSNEHGAGFPHQLTHCDSTEQQLAELPAHYKRQGETHSEAEFLDEIQTKVLRVFLLTIHSHLYSFALRVIFLKTCTTPYSFYSSVTE